MTWLKMLCLISVLLFVCPTLTVAAGPHVDGLAGKQLLPAAPGVKIAASFKGSLVVYRVGFTQCSMFVTEEGMAKTVPPSCVLLPGHVILHLDAVDLYQGFPFEILAVIETTDD